MMVRRGKYKNNPESGEWFKTGTAGDYTVWQRCTESGKTYNVTKDASPPSLGDGGYFVLASLLSLKNLSENDYKPI